MLLNESGFGQSYDTEHYRGVEEQTDHVQELGTNRELELLAYSLC